MTVNDYFAVEKIDLPFVERVYHKYCNTYWFTSHEFVAQVWDREMERLSQSQTMWLQKILDDCVEMRILKKVK